MLKTCFSRGIREVTTVVRSKKEKILEVAAQEKVIKAEDSAIVAEEIEHVPVIGEADEEPQIPEDPQEGENGHYLERRFLNLTEKWDFKAMTAGPAVNVVTGREGKNCFRGSSQHFKKACPFLN